MFEYVCALASTACDAGFGLMVTRPNAAARSLTLEGEDVYSISACARCGWDGGDCGCGWGGGC